LVAAAETLPDPWLGGAILRTAEPPLWVRGAIILVVEPMPLPTKLFTRTPVELAGPAIVFEGAAIDRLLLSNRGLLPFISPLVLAVEC
jgi:hypothetical protein